jgi:hypothetical protein
MIDVSIALERLLFVWIFRNEFLRPLLRNRPLDIQLEPPCLLDARHGSVRSTLVKVNERSSKPDALRIAKAAYTQLLLTAIGSK